MIRTLEHRQDRLRHGVVALQVEVLVVQGVRGGGGEESYMQMNVGLGWDINIGEEVKGDGGEMVWSSKDDGAVCLRLDFRRL